MTFITQLTESSLRAGRIWVHTKAMTTLTVVLPSQCTVMLVATISSMQMLQRLLVVSHMSSLKMEQLWVHLLQIAQVQDTVLVPLSSSVAG